MPAHQTLHCTVVCVFSVLQNCLRNARHLIAGTLWLLGRANLQVKVAGTRVDLLEVEETLMATTWVGKPTHTALHTAVAELVGHFDVPTVHHQPPRQMQPEPDTQHC